MVLENCENICLEKFGKLEIFEKKIYIPNGVAESEFKIDIMFKKTNR